MRTRNSQYPELISYARGTYHVRDGVQSGNPLHLCVGNTSGTEDGGSKDSDTSDTDPLLHDLEPDDQLNAAASVKLAGTNPKEHGDVRLSLSGLAFELCDVADILEFSLGLADIFATLTAESSKDVTCLFLSPNLDEPAGRFGEEPTDREEEKQWGDLESNWESPCELSSSTFVKVGATG